MATPWTPEEQRRVEQQLAQRPAAAPGPTDASQPSVAEKARQAGMSEQRFKALSDRKVSIDEWQAIDKTDREAAGNGGRRA